MKIQKIISFTLFLIFLLLVVWSQNWILFFLLITIALFFWHPNLQGILVQFFLRKHSKKTAVQEWILAVLFGLLAVNFTNNYLFSIYTIRSSSMQPSYQSGTTFLMNKILIGPAKSQNTIKSYHRIPGIRSIKQGDVIVFNFPEGDTVFINHPNENYHFQKRITKQNKTENHILNSQKDYKKVNQRPRFIKRVIALPGDTLTIINGVNYINKKASLFNENLLYKLALEKNTPFKIKKDILDKSYVSYVEKGTQYIESPITLIDNKKFSPYLTLIESPKNKPDPFVFPFNTSFRWNESNWGPMVIPQKGQKVKITLENISLYQRIIEVYEENKLEFKKDHIYINGQERTHYTFRMNYYWVGGDNKPHSFDSRYWGFLPENHIIGVIQPLPFHGSQNK